MKSGNVGRRCRWAIGLGGPRRVPISRRLGGCMCDAFHRAGRAVRDGIHEVANLGLTASSGYFFVVRPAGRTCLPVNMRRSHERLMTALQKEGLAEGQLRSREVLVGRKPMAKRWPDEQEPHTRRTHWMRSPLSSKSKLCTEGVDVNAAGISAKAGASYPGESASMSERTTAAGKAVGSARRSKPKP
jgi:hypothetical protein